MDLQAVIAFLEDRFGRWTSFRGPCNVRAHQRGSFALAGTDTGPRHRTCLSALTLIDPDNEASCHLRARLSSDETRPMGAMIQEIQRPPRDSDEGAECRRAGCDRSQPPLNMTKNLCEEIDRPSAPHSRRCRWPYDHPLTGGGVHGWRFRILDVAIVWASCMS